MTQRTQWLENPRASRSVRSIFTAADTTIVAKPDTVIGRQALDLRTVAAVCPLPSPEKVFADWLLWVPRGADRRRLHLAQTIHKCMN
jgi:hypothetical protein